MNAASALRVPGCIRRAALLGIRRKDRMKRFLPATALLVLTVAAFGVRHARAGQPIVPGTGEWLKDCGDDFEDAKWSYRYNLPKSSHEQDENQRSPGGVSNNGLWHEGGKRGTPDVVRRVATPPGGLVGSTGALLFATKNSGIPGSYSNQQQQDDLLMMFNKRLGRSIPMAWQPSCTVRVYLPRWEEWEKRNGPSFGARCDCMGRNPDGSEEAYWPGMFILRNNTKSKDDKVTEAAKLTIRGDRLGRDVRSLDIEEPGWWTLGISFSDDGQVHYYAHQGVADLMGRNPDGSEEAYWPGMFILRNNTKSKDDKVTEAAKLTIRGDRLGRDVRSLDIEEPGWWTLGISFSDDGQVHYYAHQGVADLT